MTVEVVLANGNSWVTQINTDFDGACDYYFGAGSFEQPDGSMSPVDGVIEIAPDDSVVQFMTIREYREKLLDSRPS